MPFRYVAFKFVDGKASDEERQKALAHNVGALAEGVKGLACLDVRPPSRGERLDYEQFAPYGTMLSSVEVYENGAMNIFVRSKLLVSTIGAILVRPLTGI